MSSNVLPINTARQVNEIGQAVVRGISGQSVLLDVDGMIVNANMAFSCLVKPRPEDVVLVSLLDAEYTVLAILQRDAHRQDVELQFPADLRIDAPNGAIDLSAGTDLGMQASDRAQIVAKNTGVLSQTVDLNARSLSAESRDAHLQASNLHLFAEACDSVFGRVTQRAENVMRWVEGVETLSLGSFIQNVRKSFTCRSSQAILTARQDMRIDGERIHMG